MNNKTKAVAVVLLGLAMMSVSMWFWKIPWVQSAGSAASIVILISVMVIRIFGIIVFINGLIKLFKKQDANTVGVNTVPQPPKPTLNQALIWICSGVGVWILAFLLPTLCKLGDFICGIGSILALMALSAIGLVLIVIGLINLHKSQKK